MFSLSCQLRVPTLFFIVSLNTVLSSVSARVADAQEITFPVCVLQGGTAADALDDIVHAFGTDIGQYPNEFPIPSSWAFSKVFELHLTDGVSNRWTQAEFSTLIAAIMNNDTLSTTDDIFGIVWTYFCRTDADLNPWHAGVRFSIDNSTFKKIKIRLYDFADIPDPCSSEDFGNACNGWSWQDLNVITINASPANPMDDVLDLGIGHELQHVCWEANGLAFDWGYVSCNETMATLAEYFLDSWRPAVPFDRSYDACIMRDEYCDPDSKYDVEKMWAIYLYETFKGNVSDATDDLVYKWIRSAIPPVDRMKLSGLASTIWDTAYSWVGGVDGADRLNKAFGNFLVAKYANAPSFAANSRFGVVDVSSVNDLHFFKDNCTDYEEDAVPMTPVDCPENPLPCTPPCPPDGLNHNGCWNVRILPPSYELSSLHENTMTGVPGVDNVYKDRDDTPSPTDGDGSTDFVDVATYGTDYILFRAGTYYADGNQHDFKLRIDGSARFKSPNYGENWRITPIGWVLGYCCDVDQPQTNPQHLVFVEPLTFSPATTLGSLVTSEVTITDFGRSIKMVAVAISSTLSNPNALPIFTVPGNYLDYDYEFGVFTPATMNVTWSGTVLVNADRTVPSTRTLTVQPGTLVRVATIDRTPGGSNMQKIEINVEGTLMADGTGANQIRFVSWTPTTTEDWVGFYIDAGSGGATFDNCQISRAEYAIESWVPLTVKNTTIADCRYGAVLVQGGNSLVHGCTLTRPGSFGIILNSASTTIRNTIVDDAVSAACQVSTAALLTARNSEFKNSDKGLYVGGNLTVSVDSTCTFKSNAIGIHCYGTGAATTIKNSTIESHTNNGILCNSAMWSLIQGNTIKSNVGAIFCDDGSSPIIKSNTIKSNTNGIASADGSNPDIGIYPSTGNNTIAFTTHKDILNFEMAITISAQNNCWNDNSPPCGPPANKILGPVDTNNPICCSVGQGAPAEWPGPDPKPEDLPPTVSDLLGIVPNPFNPSTTVHYSVAPPGDYIEVAVYDVGGRLVRSLVSEPKPAGNHEVMWEGTNAAGETVASAVYFVRFSAGTVTRTMKMVLLK
jgi:hypothetical protein